MPTNLKFESNHEIFVDQIVMKLGLFGVKLGPADIKRIYEMSDDELANVAVDVGLEHSSDTNLLAARLGSLGVPTRSDTFFISLLNSTTSSSTDSLQGSLDQHSRPDSRSASASSS
jgi:hypothetical protein